MYRNTEASKKFKKIEINEEFYYAIKHIFIDEEKEILIASLNNGEACGRLINNYEAFRLSQTSIGKECFTISRQEENFKFSLKGNLQISLNFLRIHDLFSEATYQRAIDELNIQADLSSYETPDGCGEMNVSKRFER